MINKTVFFYLVDTLSDPVFLHCYFYILINCDTRSLFPQIIGQREMNQWVTGLRRKAAVEPGILWRNWRLRRGYSLVMLAGLAGVPPTKVSPYLLQSTSFYHPSTPIFLHIFWRTRGDLGQSAVVRSSGCRKSVRPLSLLIYY